MNLPPRRRRIVRQGWDPGHDERVEPHHGLDPVMPDPDWGNILIHPDQKKNPAGDPTLWGNTITTVIDDDPVEGSNPRVIYGDQIVLVQAADQYARSWSLAGNISVPFNAWTVDPSPTPPGFYGNLDAAPPLRVWLQITQGIEKVTLSQQILLMSGGVDETTGAGNYGLCNTQWSAVGGPYGELLSDNAPVIGPTTQLVRSFAAIGALIGNTLSIRAVYTRGGVIGQPLDVPNASVSLIVTPYAPGQGM